MDCTPVANSATSSTRMSCSRKPTAASDMIAISIAVVMRISLDFSVRSANCPAIEENRKYGRMNTAGASCVYVPRVAASSVPAAAITPSRPMIACRNTLSLNAPSACTLK